MRAIMKEPEDWEELVKHSASLGDNAYTEYLVLMREFAIINKKVDKILAILDKEEGSHSQGPMSLPQWFDEQD